jgi:hypothetical protein
MKVLLISGACLAIAATSCKKSSTDYFCESIKEERWAEVYTYISGQASTFSDTLWQNNAVMLAADISKRDCIDTAFAVLNITESIPQYTELVYRAKLSDSILAPRTVLLEVDEKTGKLTGR